MPDSTSSAGSSMRRGQARRELDDLDAQLRVALVEHRECVAVVLPCGDVVGDVAGGGGVRLDDAVIDHEICGRDPEVAA